MVSCISFVSVLVPSDKHAAESDYIFPRPDDNIRVLLLHASPAQSEVDPTKLRALYQGFLCAVFDTVRSALQDMGFKGSPQEMASSWQRHLQDLAGDAEALLRNQLYESVIARCPAN